MEIMSNIHRIIGFTLWACFAMAGATSVQAQEVGRLKGVVTDAKTAEPLPFVQVSFYQGDSLVRGSMSDFDGVFESGPMFVGEYVMKVSTFGYYGQEKRVTLRSSGIWTEDVRLEVDPSHQNDCPVTEMGHKPEIIILIEEGNPPPPPPIHDMDVNRCGFGQDPYPDGPLQQEYEKEGVRVIVR